MERVINFMAVIFYSEKDSAGVNISSRLRENFGERVHGARIVGLESEIIRSDAVIAEYEREAEAGLHDFFVFASRHKSVT